MQLELIVSHYTICCGVFSDFQSFWHSGLILRWILVWFHISDLSICIRQQWCREELS